MTIPKVLKKTLPLCGALVLGTALAASAQSQWKVLRIRGDIRCRGIELQAGAVFEKKQHLDFSDSDNAMLVEAVGDPSITRIVYPAIWEKLGRYDAPKTCKNGCKARWVDPMVRRKAACPKF
jgi:hypothetical protein